MNLKKIIRLGFLLTMGIFFPSLNLKAQEKFFHLQWNIGLNGSQVDGDSYGGYNKPGICGGMYLAHTTDKDWTISGGFTYIQKGARKNQNPKIGDYSYYIMRLNYLEMPISIRFPFKEKFLPECGLTMGILFKSHEENILGVYQSNNLKKSDYNFLVGCGYKLSESLFLNFRYQYSLAPIRELGIQNAYYSKIWGFLFNNGQYNNVITLSAFYTPSKK